MNKVYVLLTMRIISHYNMHLVFANAFIKEYNASFAYLFHTSVFTATTYFGAETSKIAAAKYFINRFYTLNAIDLCLHITFSLVIMLKLKMFY